VTFDIDANGILNVTATDKATGKAQKVTVTASTNLKAEEVDQLVKEAAKHHAEDEQRHALAQARNEADTLIYQAEKALHELGENVPSSDRATIQNQIDALKQAAQTQDVNAIRSGIQTLQNATYALSQQMYAGQSNGGDTGRQPEGEGEDVIEGDYTPL
jgi:molecular chaperone DnaK